MLWTEEDDRKLLRLATRSFPSQWATIALAMGHRDGGKACYERFMHLTRRVPLVGKESSSVSGTKESKVLCYRFHNFESGGNGYTVNNTVVFNLEDGRFDVGIISLSRENVLKARAFTQVFNLYGEEFDDRLEQYFIQDFMEKHHRNIREHPKAMRLLRRACHWAKMALCFMDVVSIEIDSILDDIDFVSSISQARYEALNKAILRKCMMPVHRCLTDAKMQKSSVHQIVVIGGSKIPKVEQLLDKWLLWKQLRKSINQDDALAYAAALEAAILASKEGKEL